MQVVQQPLTRKYTVQADTRSPEIHGRACEVAGLFSQTIWGNLPDVRFYSAQWRGHRKRGPALVPESPPIQTPPVPTGSATGASQTGGRQSRYGAESRADHKHHHLRSRTWICHIANTPAPLHKSGIPVSIGALFKGRRWLLASFRSNGKAPRPSLFLAHALISPCWLLVGRGTGSEGKRGVGGRALVCTVGQTKRGSREGSSSEP